MSISISAKWDRSRLAGLEPGPFKRAVVKALRKAGQTALRDMRSATSKAIRRRKRIRPSYIGRAMTLRKSKGSEIADMSWALDLDGKPVPLIAYPVRQTRRGVSVEVNRGRRTIVKGSFIASMRSGHRGVFKRDGKARLPIRELRGSRPVDAMLHKGEAAAVAKRGGASFGATFVRILDLEVSK